MRLKVFLITGLLTLSCYGSDELDRFLEGATARDFQFLNEMYDATYEHRRPEIAPIPETSILRNPHDNIPPFTAVLRAGSQVQRLEDNQTLKVDRALYVRAKLHQEGSPFTYLLNQAGESVYLTRTINLSSLQEVTTLYPTTDPTVVYSDKTPFRSVDQLWNLETKLSVHFENSNAEYLAQFHRVQESSSSSQRFQIESYIDGQFFVDFGLSLSFQTGTMGETIDPNRLSYNGAYFGPALKKQVMKTQKTGVDLFIKAEKSFGLQSEDEFHQNSFSSNVYSFGADWTYQTFIGKFFFGAAYRQQQLSLKSSTDPDLQIPSMKESINGFGIYAGYRFAVTL